MREVADRDPIERFMQEVGRAAPRDVRVYLVGGTTAVLLGWRSSTIDIDLVMQPEDETLLRTIVALKESLRLNIELASPADFIPVPASWEDRSTYITTVGRVAFYHYDLYAQALAKAEADDSRTFLRRTPDCYRQYDREALEELRFIKKAQALGLRLGDIREIMEISSGGEPPSEHVRATVTERLAEVEERLRELRDLRATLRETLERLDRAARPESGCRCAVIESS